MTYCVTTKKVREEMHYLLTVVPPELRQAVEDTVANILREEKWVDEPQAKPVVYRE